MDGLFWAVQKWWDGRVIWTLIYFTEQPITEITIGVAFGLLVLLGVAILLVYRKIKEESTLSSMDWLANWSEIVFNHNPQAESRVTMNSAKSKMSFTEGPSFGLHHANSNGKDHHQGPERDVSTHSTMNHRTATATFRGVSVMVRHTEKHKIDLSKGLLLEIRDVRTATQENLLRFVGAILGPERTAVITEMCSKGNLQVSLADNSHHKFRWSLKYNIAKSVLLHKMYSIDVK